MGKMNKETLSDKFTAERRKINSEIPDERVQAHCHTTINKIEEDVNEFVQRLKDKCKEHDIVKVMMYEFIEELAGDRFK